MCRSKADGGQRCFSHARTALAATKAATIRANGVEKIVHDETYQSEVRDRLVDLASTTRGRAMLAHIASGGNHPDASPDAAPDAADKALIMDKLFAVYGDDAKDAFDGLQRIREEGKILAERNEATRGNRLARFKEKAKGIVQALAIPAAATAAIAATGAPNAAVQMAGGMGLLVGTIAFGLYTISGGWDVREAKRRAQRPPSDRELREQARWQVAQRQPAS